MDGTKSIEKYLEDMDEVEKLMREFVTKVVSIADDEDDAFNYLLAAVGTILDTACIAFGRDISDERKKLYKVGTEVDKEIKRMEEMPWFS